MLAIAHRRRSRTCHRRGFSVTELLVVIGIIILLVGLLLPALGKAQERARAAQTQSTMESFAQACEAFRQEFGYYPGVVPESTLAETPLISGTENAILALMGGFVREEDGADDYANFDGDVIDFNGYRIKVDTGRIGEGPRINGQQFAPFFAPKASELVLSPGQNLADNSSGSDPFADDPYRIPDLVDGWGNPIILVRAMRSSGPLVGAPDSFAQFATGSMTPYLVSRQLGESGQDQTDSVLNSAADVNGTFAQIIRHPGFGAADQPIAGTARGQIVLISAGPDGVYFSRFDGPGSPGDAEDDIASIGPAVVDEYDDIRVFGGG